LLLMPIFVVFVCYHIYIASSEKRKSTKKIILILLILIFTDRLIANITFEKFLWNNLKSYKMTSISMEPTIF
jgi:hypothetical protein